MAKHAVSRRNFMGGMAAAVGYLSTRPSAELWAQGGPAAVAAQRARGRMTPEQYDRMAKIANNENNWGPPESVMKAMNDAWKYVGRYGYPDGGIVQEIANLHGVQPENVLLSAGSGEILDVVGTTFLMGGKKVLGADPSYGSVYQHATSIQAEAIKVPLKADYSQDTSKMIELANRHAGELGFYYLCNPNNPTGMVVPKQEVKAIIEGLPKDMPILIDEAYHHFVNTPAYETSIPYVLEGRPVIVARTFSKIAGLAAMRLGYAVAPAAIIQKMRPFSMGSINVLVKHGGVASLKDTAAQAEVKQKVIALRTKTTDALKAHGYDTIPSETNFFMVHLGRQVQPVIEAFREKEILVGRPFPPMLEHLRVSIGTAEEMDRFVVAFKQIFPAKAQTNVAGQ
ncbi:MAG: aminotransferase class I/II-fold pyridoxal phosphate-dependent enzyme [Acidobacteriota bacterium]|nr:aminotransferase class I/II-fold pyridoxal phosphate-dependent enzyme [Acidobacteriota bacterium]